MCQFDWPAASLGSVDQLEAEKSDALVLSSEENVKTEIHAHNYVCISKFLYVFHDWSVKSSLSMAGFGDMVLLTELLYKRYLCNNSTITDF